MVEHAATPRPETLESASLNLSSLTAEQAAKPNPEPQEPQVWEKFDNWYHGLSREDRLKGMRSGQWPEGTPQIYADLATKTTPEERLMVLIFGEKPLSIKEIQARPADYIQRQEEERRQRKRQRLASARGVPAESITDQDLGGASHQLLREQVSDVLASLSDQERLVLENLYGLDDGRSRTLAEVGRLIGRSGRDVRKIEKTALSKLKQPSRSGQLKDYLQ